VSTPAPGSPTCSRPSRSRSGTSCWRTSRRCCATWTGCATGTAARRSARSAPARSAGSSLPLDPTQVAKELGLRRRRANSIDAVADRDFAAEFLFVAALLGVHLSRLGEEVVIWTTPQFGWVELDDAFAPARRSCRRRRTPDIAELARASPAG
jgi:hypothetical protein